MTGLTAYSGHGGRIFNRNFSAVFAINLFVMTGYYLLFVVMSPFATQRFGAQLDIAGLVAGGMVLGCLSGRFIAGGIIARVGFRKMLYLGLVLYIGTMALYSRVDSLPLLLANRFVGGIGVGCIGTMTGTVVALVVPPEKRGLGVSVFSLSTVIALAAGPFLGINLMRRIDFQDIFMLCLGFGVLSLLIALASVRIAAQPGAHSDRQAEPGAQTRRRRFCLSDYIEYSAVPIGIVLMVASCCYITVQSFLSLYAQQIDQMGAAGLYFLVYGIAVFVSRPLTGKIFDQRGENPVAYPALLLSGLAFLVLAYAASAWAVLLSAVLLAFGYGNFQSVAQAATLRAVEPHRFGQTTSTYFILLDLGIGFGPYLFGFLAQHAGYRGLFLTAAVISLLCVPLYAVCHARRGGRHNRTEPPHAKI